MIVSHRAPSSLNMSSYRARWTHFRPNSMIFISLILQLLASGTCPRYIHHRFIIDSRQIWDRYTIIKLTNMGETYFQESDLQIWVKNMFRNFGSPFFIGI